MFPWGAERIIPRYPFPLFRGNRLPVVAVGGGSARRVRLGSRARPIHATMSLGSFEDRAQQNAPSLSPLLQQTHLKPIEAKRESMAIFWISGEVGRTLLFDSASGWSSEGGREEREGGERAGHCHEEQKNMAVECPIPPIICTRQQQYTKFSLNESKYCQLPQTS